MAEPTTKPFLELGIEFAAEFLLFLYPYGAEQMSLPHNFWLGLGCWILGTAIAIRMFWIFPVWTHRLSRLEKGLIAFILVGLFVASFYKPVVTAYGKHNAEARPKAESSKQVEKPKELEQQPETKPIPAARTPTQREIGKANTISGGLPSKPTFPPPSVSQSNSGGINVQQATTGENSPIVNSPITVNSKPSPLVLLPHQLKAIKSALEPFRGQAMRIFSVPPTQETVEFAEKLAMAADEAGVYRMLSRAGSLITEAGGIPQPGLTFCTGSNRIDISNALITVLVEQRVVESE